MCTPITHSCGSDMSRLRSRTATSIMRATSSIVPSPGCHASRNCGTSTSMSWRCLVISPEPVKCSIGG
ncbi:hypothetical protein VTI28DRAFT_4245 [Corynascus sepedonium]